MLCCLPEARPYSPRDALCKRALCFSLKSPADLLKSHMQVLTSIPITLSLRGGARKHAERALTANTRQQRPQSRRRCLSDSRPTRLGTRARGAPPHRTPSGRATRPLSARVCGPSRGPGQSPDPSLCHLTPRVDFDAAGSGKHRAGQPCSSLRERPDSGCGTGYIEHVYTPHVCLTCLIARLRRHILSKDFGAK